MKITDAKDIERLTARQSTVPEGCDDAAAMLFITLRALRWGFDRGYIDKEQAGKEKMRALRAYEGWRFWENIFAEAAKRNNELAKLKSTVAVGNCEVCKKIMAITEGRTTA